uniref:Solute carrier family 7 (cationic amino acid transporter, y+ system), member 15 n=1 Tax=Nannospalax galili TaxID=1026970 RepID=A0A8C6R089_NANGA
AGQEQGSGASELTLRRELHLWSAISMTTGYMISSCHHRGSWFTLVVLEPVLLSGQSVASWPCWVPRVMLNWVPWFLNLGESMPTFLRTFGPLPAFLVIYTFVLVGRPAAIPAVSLSFSEYALAPFCPGCSSLPQVVVKNAAALCILLLMLVSFWSSQMSTMLMNVCTAAKVFLLVIVVGGAVVLGQGRHCTEALLFTFYNMTEQAGHIGMAFYQELWSFDGWNSLNIVIEELKNQKQNLVWALMIAIPLVTILYVLVNISYLLLLSPSETFSSDAIAVSWGNQVLGSWAWLVPLAAALSMFGTVNGSFFGGSRMCYAAAREGHMGRDEPQLISVVHMHHLTPAPALMFITAMALALIIPGEFSTIVNFVSFFSWLTYGTTIGYLLYLRIKTKDLPKSYKVPTLIPAVVLLVSLFLVLAPIIDHPRMEFLYILLFLLSGFLCQPKCLQTATVHLQLLMEVAPTTKDQ